MKKILIFGGTTEGRELAYLLDDAGISCTLCVATEYGEQVMEERPHIQVRMGRLDEEAMRHLYQSEEYAALVDATHPYATLVTENIKKSLVGNERLLYLRLERNTGSLSEENVSMFDSEADCVKALEHIEGEILLTTGSKELSIFSEKENIKKRLVVRVLPGKESIDLCYENGLSGKQIIAMQGPFSKEMNLAMIKQYHIKCLVTKESGTVGGLDTKLEAAREAKIPVYIIKKKDANQEKTYSFYEVCKELEAILGVNLQNQKDYDIVLAGVGMGNSDTMTLEVQKRIQESDYLFGAKRLIKEWENSLVTYPYYLAKDIIPILEKNRGYRTQKVTILFSGDSGFYSGAEKMKPELEQLPNTIVTIYPGISSLSYMAAKLGINWQQAKVISAHGVSAQFWQNELWRALQTSEKIFMLTSSVADVKEIAYTLSGLEKTDISLAVAYQLSYANEWVKWLTPKECEALTEEGLYTVWIQNNIQKKSCITPGIEDEAFLRDQVPMTKEEIREISICRLKLKEGDCVYDIGSGTGSIAIEIAKINPSIQVYAIETNPVACELIQRNIEKFAVRNVKLIEGMAPEALMDLPVPNCAFVGGSKGKLKDIVDALRKKNGNVRIVANAVSMETTKELMDMEKEVGLTYFSMSQVAVTHTRKVGNYRMMQGENPVWICTMQFGEDTK